MALFSIPQPPLIVNRCSSRCGNLWAWQGIFHHVRMEQRNWAQVRVNPSPPALDCASAWPAVSSSYCLVSPAVMDCNLKLWAQEDLLLEFLLSDLIIAMANETEIPFSPASWSRHQLSCAYSRIKNLVLGDFQSPEQWISRWGENPLHLPKLSCLLMFLSD